MEKFTCTSDNEKSNNYKYSFFGDRLIHVMMIRGISCKELAERIYTAPSTVTGYRTGRRSPDVGELTIIAKELNVSLDYLLGLKATPDKLFEDEK